MMSVSTTILRLFVSVWCLFQFFFLALGEMQKKAIMTHDFKLLIKPHLDTSNIYVRHTIVKANIANCNMFISFTPRPTIYSDLYWSIVQERKKQEAILKDINKQIKNIEQMGFAFGSNFLDQ